MTTDLALELRQHLALVSTGLISESEAAALREDTGQPRSPKTTRMMPEGGFSFPMRSDFRSNPDLAPCPRPGAVTDPSPPPVLAASSLRFQIVALRQNHLYLQGEPNLCADGTNYLWAFLIKLCSSWARRPHGGDLLEMPDILIRCPVTGQAVLTGLTTEIVVLDSLPNVAIPLKCPHCEQTHAWTPMDAWVGQSSDRRH